MAQYENARVDDLGGGLSVIVISRPRRKNAMNDQVSIAERLHVQCWTLAFKFLISKNVCPFENEKKVTLLSCPHSRLALDRRSSLEDL